MKYRAISMLFASLVLRNMQDVEAIPTIYKEEVNEILETEKKPEE